MLNSMQDAAMQQAMQSRQSQDDQQYDQWGQPRGRYDRWGQPVSKGPQIGDPFRDDIGQQIANGVVSSVARWAGRGIANRLQRAYSERIVPAMAARQEQNAREQAAIVERYPELRGCLRDEVIFLAGGSRTVPISDISMPVTLAQADALVGRLHG